MAMNITIEDKRILKQISFYTGTTDAVLKKVFKCILEELISNFENGSDTKIPYFGTFKISYPNDEIIEVSGVKGKRANINIEFTPDANLLTNLGQLKDHKVTDVETQLMNWIRQGLQDISSD